MCLLYLGEVGRSTGWEQLEVKVSMRRRRLCGFYLSEKERLSFGPMWSNLLRQHINYTARLGCHLLQTGQIPIERSRYKKHLRFVYFLWNVTHTEWEDMLWIITNSQPQCAARRTLDVCSSSVMLVCHTEILYRVCKKSGIVTKEGGWLYCTANIANVVQETLSGTVTVFQYFFQCCASSLGIVINYSLHAKKLDYSTNYITVKVIGYITCCISFSTASLKSSLHKSICRAHTLHLLYSTCRNRKQDIGV